MELFNKSVDELIPLLTTHKINLLRFLKRNFKQNIHFIEVPMKRTNNDARGGHNRMDILLTEEAFELLKNSYNMRNRNITTISSNIKVFNLVMPIENQTLSFIETAYDGVTETIRQYSIDQYRVDMYFPKYKIIIECDEFNHVDRNPIDELERETYLISQGNHMIRYNPNENEFDMSIVLRDINRIIMLSITTGKQF